MAHRHARRFRFQTCRGRNVRFNVLLVAIRALRAEGFLHSKGDLDVGVCFYSRIIRIM